MLTIAGGSTCKSFSAAPFWCWDLVVRIHQMVKCHTARTLLVCTQVKAAGRGLVRCMSSPQASAGNHLNAFVNIEQLSLFSREIALNLIIGQ